MRNLFVLAFFCLSYFTVDAKIIETRHIEDVLPLIDDKSWFFVDLDNCMFEGTQALGHADWFYKEVNDRMQKGMTKEEAIRDFYPNWIKTQIICQVKPLESAFIPALLKLQTKGVVIMGLTNRQPSVAEYTFRQVASLGFDFSKTAPSLRVSIPTKEPTLYSHGILFVGDYNKKGEILKQFLSLIHQSPKKILFIDDKRKNVEELQNFENEGIEYTGVHYTAIEHAKPIFDPEIAKFQYKFLNHIMSNEAALLLMEKGIGQ